MSAAANKKAAKAAKPAPSIKTASSSPFAEGSPDDFYGKEARNARCWWAGLTERQRAFWRGEAKVDTLAGAWNAFFSEISYWGQHQLPDQRPVPKPVEPKDDPKFLRTALRECDSFSQTACDEIEATARGAKALLAVNAQAIVSVSRLLDVIVERAMDLQNSVNSLAEGGGANFKDEDERAFSSRIWQQYHALKNGGAA